MSAYKYRRRVNGKWEYVTPTRWCYEFEINKKRVRSKPIYKTKREALAAEKDARAGYVEITTRKYSEVYKEVSEQYITHKSPRTRYDYDSIYRLHIQPFLPDKNIDRYQRSDLENLKSALTKAGRSNHCINKVISKVNTTMTYALQHGYIAFNPFEHSAKLPHSKKEKEFLSYEEFQLFIDEIDDPMYHLLFDLLFWTGIRRGELLALQWKDIDFKRSFIKIRKHMIYNGSGKYQIIPGRKRGTSYEVEVHSELANELKEQKARVRNIDGFTDDRYLFYDYKPISPETIRSHLSKGLKAAKLRHVDIHSFRHAHVSYIYNYCPELTLQDIAARIGDTVEVCLRTYSHIFSNRYGKYSTAIENSIKRVSPAQEPNAEQEGMPANNTEKNMRFEEVLEAEFEGTEKK